MRTSATLMFCWRFWSRGLKPLFLHRPFWGQERVFRSLAIFLAICKFVLPFVAGAVSLAFHKSRSKEREFINHRVRYERLRALLLHLDEVVANVVKELSQTMAEAFRLAADGKLTPEAKAILKAQAVTMVRDYMGAHGMDELRTLLKLAEEAFMQFVGSKIEAKVHDVKALQRASSIPATGIRLPAPTAAAA